MAASNYSDYIPAASISYVDSLMANYGIDLKIVNQRQTKHGDFRRSPSGKMQITVNNNLNPEQFIITLIHEIAHYVTFKTYGRVQPHGTKWKQTFQQLMLPILNPYVFPDHILHLLATHLKNPKASTDSDPKLSLALKNGQSSEGMSFVHELNLGTIFEYKNQRYKRGTIRRTRIECLNLSNNRVYLFHQNAEVKVTS